MPDARSTLLAALPVALAVGVFGVSYGVLATAAGVPAAATLAMSAFVFAGSSQFAFVAVIAGGGGPLAAALSGTLLNLRYLATGAAVAPVLPGGPLRRGLLAQLVVDESYAVGVAAGEPGRPDRFALLAAGALVWICWFVGSALGLALGPVLGDPVRLGLDAAFPALFVALLWPMLTGRAVRIALAGAVVALVLAPLTPAGVPLAGAAAAGLVLSR